MPKKLAICKRPNYVKNSSNHMYQKEKNESKKYMPQESIVLSSHYQMSCLKHHGNSIKLTKTKARMHVWIVEKGEYLKVAIVDKSKL